MFGVNNSNSINDFSNIDFELDGFDLDVDLLTVNDISFGFDPSSSNTLLPSDGADLNKPYHAKRPHKKSRAGCHQCKKRKVKCDEVRPTCKSCRLRREKCAYPAVPASSSLTYRAKSDASSGSSSPEEHSPQPYQNEIVSQGTTIMEPLYRPREMADDLDMKLLWFWTSHGYRFFSIKGGRSSIVDNVLQVKFVQHAFQSPFLMHCLMAVSASHLRNLGQPVPAHRAISYSTKAFESYRTAIEAAKPEDFPALIATSLLMVAVSSQMFRETDRKPLHIFDWIQVWRGIGLIIDVVSPKALQESGMAVLFHRPRVDLKKASTHIPNNLLSMVESIGPGDADEEYKEVYHDMLKYLGSLYQELKEYGFNPILDLRIIIFYTYLPKPFIPLAKEHRPRALVMIAHHLCFLKMLPKVWWINGIADHEIRQICQEVGSEWAHLLRVPEMVLKTDDRVEMARLIIDNHNWTPSEMDQYERDHDPRLNTDLKLHDNQGIEMLIWKGEWRRRSSISDIESDSSLDQNPDISNPIGNTSFDAP